jgi:hypothetical protein
MTPLETQEKKLILKILLFGLLNLGILAAVLCYFSGRDRGVRLKNWETESNLLMMGENEHYGCALLGTSRGRVFSRDGNHLMLEEILNERVINLAKGGGGGLMPAEMHLSYFFSRGNTADHIIYLVDPWVFFAPINNEDNDFFLRDEPFELFILWKLLCDRYPSDRISSYLQMIAEDDWEGISRYAAPGLTENTLQAIEGEKLEEARQYYLETYRRENFEKYSGVVDAINALAEKHGSRITYVMLPILIPDFPGVHEVDRKLREAASQEDHVLYYNFVTSMQARQFFYDHMHFNKTGIAYFTRNCLYPILHGTVPALDQEEQSPLAGSTDNGPPASNRPTASPQSAANPQEAPIEARPVLLPQ